MNKVWLRRLLTACPVRNALAGSRGVRNGNVCAHACTCVGEKGCRVGYLILPLKAGEELGLAVETLPQAEGCTDTKLREGPQCLERHPLAGEESRFPEALDAELSNSGLSIQTLGWVSQNLTPLISDEKLENSLYTGGQV